MKMLADKSKKYTNQMIYWYFYRKFINKFTVKIVVNNNLKIKIQNIKIILKINIKKASCKYLRFNFHQ